MKNFYTASVIEIIKRPPYWDCIKVGINDFNGNQIGSYDRNYPDLKDTFFPFKQGNQWYALYSPNYSVTRIMTLPDCVDIGGEEIDSKGGGFCPIDYYVPFGTKFKDKKYKDIDGMIGFVAGCFWGGDSSFDIALLDLSDVKNGKLTRTFKFGAIGIPYTIKLKDAVRFDKYSEDNKIVSIAYFDNYFIHEKKLQGMSTPENFV